MLTAHRCLFDPEWQSKTGQTEQSAQASQSSRYQYKISCCSSTSNDQTVGHLATEWSHLLDYISSITSRHAKGRLWCVITYSCTEESQHQYQLFLSPPRRPVQTRKPVNRLIEDLSWTRITNYIFKLLCMYIIGPL